VYQPRREGAVTFAQLLDLVAGVSPELRVRFTSPHPKDFTDDVLQVGQALGVLLGMAGAMLSCHHASVVLMGGRECMLLCGPPNKTETFCGA
jgi:hypothetical protein